ncbi:MAG: RsiV family protein [Saprospiraceae bacterium]
MCRFKNIIPFIILLAITALFACKNEPQTATTSASAARAAIAEPFFKLDTLKKTIGDCGRKEDCLEVIAKYPIFEGGDTQARFKINANIAREMMESLEIGDTSGLETIGQAVLLWSDAFKEYLSEDIGDKVTLTYFCDGKGTIHENHAVTELPVTTYTGGAHPNHYTTLANYNLKTGDEILLEDIITDEKKFKIIVEKAFYGYMNQKEESFQKEDFFWDKPFYLPANFALTEKGIKFIYNPYEIAAYVFGSMEFIVPYADLAGTINLP